MTITAKNAKNASTSDLIIAAEAQNEAAVRELKIRARDCDQRAKAFIKSIR